MFPKITIIGRPNVGKSSFFNMFVGHKIAIVHDDSGTTRDISEFEFYDKKNDVNYILSDSGGLDFSSNTDDISNDIRDRTILSMQDSDLLIWIIEYDKFIDLDEKILKLLRSKKFSNFIILANKADNIDMQNLSFEFSGKGELEFFPISVSHNFGIEEVKDYIYKYLKENKLNFSGNEIDDSLKLSIIGRPNVGKSSILNAIVGRERSMVKDMSGTTRDSVDTKFTYNNVDFTLIDTAGIRRLSRVGIRNVEDWSILRTERSITRSDIVCVVIDGVEAIVGQDLNIISKSLEEHKGLIIVVNKWDKVLEKPGINKDQMMLRYIEYLKEKIEFLPWVSIIFTSATEKKRVNEILERAIEIEKERKKRVKTAIFNEFLEQVIYKHPPTGNKKSHKPKIYYGSQVDVNPPKFVISVNNPNHFHFSYKRYLENRIRENFLFNGTPIIIEFKGRGKFKEIIK